MIILDTDVISALIRDPADLAVARWIDQQPNISLWTSSVTVMEIRFGLHLLERGKRAAALQKRFDSFLAELDNRIAPFDEAAAEKTAELMALRRRKGRVIGAQDAMIAGIALALNASVATRNTRDFSDLSVPVVNPWQH